MSVEKIHATFVHAVVAAADLSAKLHYFATIDSSGLLAVCGDGAVVAGPIIETAVAGKPATFQYGGIGKVKVGSGGVTAGARIASDASGLAVVAAAGDFEAGTALSAGDEGDIISYVISTGRRHA